MDTRRIWFLTSSESVINPAKNSPPGPWSRALGPGPTGTPSKDRPRGPGPGPGPYRYSRVSTPLVSGCSLVKPFINGYESPHPAPNCSIRRQTVAPGAKLWPPAPNCVAGAGMRFYRFWGWICKDPQTPPLGPGLQGGPKILWTPCALYDSMANPCALVKPIRTTWAPMVSGSGWLCGSAGVCRKKALRSKEQSPWAPLGSPASNCANHGAQRQTVAHGAKL